MSAMDPIQTRGLRSSSWAFAMRSPMISSRIDLPVTRLKRASACRREHGNRQKTSALGSERIWSYTEEIINENVKKGNIKDE